MKHNRDQKVIKAFGLKVRSIRLGMGWTQEELANESNLEISQINRIELGKINTSISHAAIIARALGIEMKELFDF